MNENAFQERTIRVIKPLIPSDAEDRQAVLIRTRPVSRLDIDQGTANEWPSQIFPSGPNW